MSPGVAAAAEALWEAQARGVPCPPVRALLPEGDAAAAYAVQEALTERCLAAGGRLVGRKIGLTAAAVQRQLGVDRPDYGMLFADMWVPDGGEVPNGAVLQPRVEAEVALVLERDLDAAAPTAADLLRATAYAVPAIEVVGSRIADWDIRFADTVADNASAALYVLGGPARRLDGLDLAGCRMAMARRAANGGEAAEVSAGTGAACLGSPLNAAVWLARTMVAFGRPLRAGDTVLTGALGPMAPVAPGDAFEARVEGLGAARVAFAAGAGAGAAC